VKYRLAIFDFDGTLADSFPFFSATFNALADRHGFARIDPAQAHALRGLGPRQMMSHVGLPSWKLPFVARDFIARMGEAIHTIRPFAGVDAALAQLADAGAALAVVSSNGYDNVSRVLGPQNTRLFRHVECGMSMFGKAASLRSVLRKTGMRADEAIYVGDQSADLQAARKAGIAFGAVAWGYATIESLREHRPEEEFASVDELARIAAGGEG
jgi:phosphoglycolate phosphatase